MTAISRPWRFCSYSTPVKRQKDFKTRLLGQRQQISVLLSRPTLFRNGMAFMSMQVMLEFSGKTFV